MKKINRTWLFLILAFAISYSMAAAFYLAGGEYDALPGTILAVAYMFTPMAAVLVVEKFVHKEKVRRSLFISFKINKWFVVGWALPPALAFASFAVALLWPGVSFSPEMAGMFARYEDALSPEQIEQIRLQLQTLPVHPVWLMLAQGLLAGATINAVAGFGEELGWRGFLLKQFRHFSFWKASAMIGFVWGIWHAPLILMGHNYPGFPVIGVGMMAVWTMLLTPMFNYITIKSRSVIAAAVMHGSLNGTVGLSIVMLAGGNELTVGMTGAAGFIAVAAATALFVIYDQRLSKERIMSGKVGDYWENQERRREK